MDPQQAMDTQALLGPFFPTPSPPTSNPLQHTTPITRHHHNLPLETDVVEDRDSNDASESVGGQVSPVEG